MADRHPYVNAPGVLKAVLDQLRRSFPDTLTADVLKKLGFAPKNESYMINTIRFLGLIDASGARTATAQKAFTLHDDDSFARSFSDIVKKAYAELFKLHGDAAWSLPSSSLITFFRQTDQSTELVGTLQAKTFSALAAYAGHAEANATPPRKPAPRATGKAPKRRAIGATPKVQPPDPEKQAVNSGGRAQPPGVPGDLALTVRIEINLPAGADQDTYDRIFRSIRENLLGQ